MFACLCDRKINAFYANNHCVRKNDMWSSGMVPFNRIDNRNMQRMDKKHSFSRCYLFWSYWMHANLCKMCDFMSFVCLMVTSIRCAWLEWVRGHAARKHMMCDLWTGWDFFCWRDAWVEPIYCIVQVYKKNHNAYLESICKNVQLETIL